MTKTKSYIMAEVNNNFTYDVLIKIMEGNTEVNRTIIDTFKNFDNADQVAKELAEQLKIEYVSMR